MLSTKQLKKKYSLTNPQFQFWHHFYPNHKTKVIFFSADFRPHEAFFAAYLTEILNHPIEEIHQSTYFKDKFFFTLLINQPSPYNKILSTTINKPNPTNQEMKKMLKEFEYYKTSPALNFPKYFLLILLFIFIFLIFILKKIMKTKLNKLPKKKPIIKTLPLDYSC